MEVNVIAEATVQVLVEDTVDLFTPALKIDEIRAEVRDLRCNIIPGKVIFQGILHKQIFFVNEDNVVVHQGVDIPFSGFVEIAAAEPGQICQLAAIIEFIEFELLSPTSLREITVIRVNVRLLDMLPLENVLITTPANQAIFLGNRNSFVAREKVTSTKKYV
ncbi:MAG: DUF3794 domain-containing protein [Firmicutes bacterium]|nr:DUF3794 domain-containing protein [Bacillota bacterium]